VSTVTLTVTLTGPGAQESADRLVQAISDVDQLEAQRQPGPVIVDTVSRQVVLDGQAIRFTRREYDLLLFLACHPSAAFTRGQLLRAVWGHEFSGERTVDVHVRRIRVKLGSLGDSLATVHGYGYRLESSHLFSVVRQSF
jgi:two-component system OmpR family response regulator